MPSLNTLTLQTADYAKTRRAALDLAGTMQAEIEAVQAKYDKQIKRAVTKMTEDHERLSQAIEASPQLFESTKSMTIDGIKIGFQIGKEKLKVAEEAIAVATLEKLWTFYNENDDITTATKIRAAMKVKTTLVDSALKKLDTSILTSAGITLVPATNDVLIKPQDDDSTKAIDNIIKTVLSELET